MDLLIPEVGIVAWVVLFILGIVLPLAALITLFKSNQDYSGKIGWLLAILFVPMIGSVLYFTVGRSKD